MQALESIEDKGSGKIPRYYLFQIVCFEDTNLVNRQQLVVSTLYQKSSETHEGKMVLNSDNLEEEQLLLCQ